MPGRWHPKARAVAVDIYFSDHFGVSRRKIERYGAFDISLVADLPLFIDPFLLFNSRRPPYRALHKRIIDYLIFLREKAADESLSPHLIDSWYRFKEVKQTWLGFSRTGNQGAGLGKDFAIALHSSLNGLFHDFGEKQRITKGSHLEKLCLIREGVGRDKISDFTTRLILQYLCEYTHRNARQPQPQDFLDLQHRDLALGHLRSMARPRAPKGHSRKVTRRGGMVLKNSRTRGGMLLKKSGRRGP